MPRPKPVPRSPLEPRRDLAAQVRAMRDPSHPRVAVFAARGQVHELPMPIGRERRIDRPEGSLLTISRDAAERFAGGLDPTGLAALLGFPATSPAALRSRGGQVFQALDEEGSVVAEAAATPSGREEALACVARQVPPGGMLNEITATAALQRRGALRIQGE